MSGEITLTDGVNSATIAKPRYGYTSEISMPLTYAARVGTSYGVNDDSSTYDRRMCRDVTFDLDATDMEELSDLLRDDDKGRGSDLTLQLGASASGFFPFGPDKGDKGNFTVRVTRFDQGGQKHRPWKYWAPSLDIALISAPAYSITDDLDDGSLQVGSVSGIRYPQTGYDVKNHYAVNNIVTLNSTGQEVDMGNNADDYESVFTFSGNGGKIGSLVAYLVGTARGSDAVTFVAPANNYPFGRDKAANGSFTIQFLYSRLEANRAILSIVHNGFDQFSFQTRMRFVSI